MSLKERMEKFNRRWNVTSTDTYEESFKKFKTRVLNILKDIDQHVTAESIKVFCQYYGVSEVWDGNMYSDETWSTNIIDRLKQEDREIEFYRLIELIFSLDIQASMGFRGEETYSRQMIFRELVQAIHFSDINLAVTVSDDDVILYPKGEKEFDTKLVNQVLSFLNDVSNSHFVDALKNYQANKSIKSAESLRRSLEEFLRYKLKNTRGLEANIDELQKQLKKDGRDPQIRNVLFQTFSYLDKYFNENSKHKDGDIKEYENEYLIYQTGLLMRYVNTSL